MGRTCSEGAEGNIFIMWGGQVTGSLIEMGTEEFYAFITMRISFMSHVTCLGELGKVYNVLVC